VKHIPLKNLSTPHEESKGNYFPEIATLANLAAWQEKC